MFCLSVRYMKNSAKLDNNTLEKLRNNVGVTAAHQLKGVHNSKNFSAAIISNLNKSSQDTIIKGSLQMSRYSANTTMPHFKEFRMLDYDVVGFDLDGTLLRYDLNNMVVLEHELLKEFLVYERNYPKELICQKFQGDFLQKGLIIDCQRGNILKLSENGTILKASHGTRFMTDDAICQVYGDERKWDIAQEYIKDPLSAWNGPIAEKLRTLLDYFDIGASLVFAQTVDILDKLSPNEYALGRNDYKIWPDMLAGLIRIYSREYFASGESAYFEALKGNPDKYLLKTNKSVIKLLKDLKASGKALYLLTGSNIDFADFTASYALGPHWRELFDYIIGFAKKPGFFFAQRQFLKIKNLREIEGSELPLNNLLKPNSCYSQGNWQQLKESMCKQILRKDPKQVRSLYVGDNLIQDVFAPNSMASIEILALSEELLEYDNNYDFKSIVHSPLWGSYFNDVDGTPTLWSKIIEKYSQLCVSDMDVVAKIPVKQKIQCENKEGYFPKQPEGLLIR